MHTLDEIWVRRLDLKIRDEFPGLKTVIGSTQKQGYTMYYIHCLNFNELSHEIIQCEKENRQLCLPCKVVFTDFNEDEKVIPQLKKDDISMQTLGNLVTASDIVSYLMMKFPDVDFKSHKSIREDGYYLCVYVAPTTSDEAITEIKRELQCQGHMPGVLVKRYTNANNKSIPNENQIDNTTRVFNIMPNKNLSFVKDEEDFWQENEEKIYTGEYTRNKIINVNSERTRCYLDFTMFDNVNLRNLLLLYDEIYITPPFDDGMNNFFANQHINRNDLMTLVEQKRLNFILTNYEERYNTALLKDVYCIRKDAVVGRRRTDALLAAFITELDNIHRENNPRLDEWIHDLLFDRHKQPSKEIDATLKIMQWPTRAKSMAIRSFTTEGPISIEGFGVHNTFTFPPVEETDKIEDMKLGVAFHALSPHIASALEATYCPIIGDYSETDTMVSNMIGNLFKFYRCGSNAFLLRDKISNQSLEIKLLDISTDIDIVGLSEQSAKIGTTKMFRDILKKIYSLSAAEQEEAIATYNNILWEWSLKRKQSKVNPWSIGIDICALMLGFCTEMSIIMGLMVLVKDAKLIRKLTLDDDLKEVLEKYNNIPFTIDELHLLDRFSPAVRLKKYGV